MKKVTIFGLIGTGLILATILVFFASNRSANLQKPIGKVASEPKNLKTLNFETLEIASTIQKREKGLMNRSTLCKSCAMLFIFDDSQLLSFWMKNTLIPLDIIFLDEQYKITKIHQSTTPLQTSPTYSSEIKSKYVIETNAYFTKENNINVGDLIDIPKLIDSSSN
jgi:uncharacterized membrane protein (UPF0127 family)